MSKMAAKVSGIISNKERIGRVPRVSIIFLQTFSDVFNVILNIVGGNGLHDYIYLPKKANNKLCWKQQSIQLEKWRMDLGMETSTSLCSQVYVYTHTGTDTRSHMHTIGVHVDLDLEKVHGYLLSHLIHVWFQLLCDS